MSISTSLSRRTSTFPSFGLRKKNDIDIVLDEQEAFINSYTTHDKIEGHVVIKFDRDTTFDDLMITFEGQTITYVEKIATTAPTTGRITGKHTFLKLLQPIDPAVLPDARTARVGVKYEIPFNFVVPEQLLPHICTHSVQNSEVLNAHIQLPPSFGDPMLASDGQTLVDDMAPDMARISYCVRVRMIKRSSSGRLVDIADKAIRLRIVPATEEQPPVPVPEDDKDFELRKEKDVKRGIFKLGKIGRLTAEAIQPRTLRLPAPKTKSPSPVTTITTVNLRFDPHDANDQPPALGSIVSKLRAETFFGATPFKQIPRKSSVNVWDTSKGSYIDSVELSSRCISTVPWTRHEDQTSAVSTELARRPSVISTASASNIPEPSSTYGGAHFWAASVLVPISLPTNKVFTPSFNSCIVSRAYTLELNVSYHSPGTNVSLPSVVLKLPIQISSEGNLEATRQMSAAEAEAMAEREVDRDFFTPRDADLASPEYTERPEYSALGTRHASIAAPPAYHPGYMEVRRGNVNSRTQSVIVRAAC